MTIEHVLAFPTEADAQSDPVVGSYWISGGDGFPGSWRGDVCIPHLHCWDTRADVVSTDADGNTVVTHTEFDSRWRLCIGLREVDPALRDHPACILVSDCWAREVDKAPVEVWVLKSAVPLDQVPFFVISP